MLIKKYNSIMQQGEDYRNKWAFGLTVACSALVLTGFVFYKGFINFGDEGVLVKNSSNTQTASLIAVDMAPSPLESSRDTLDEAIDQIVKQYNSFKESLESVLVPFVTGIDVYESN